jgi:hypothetical protein
MSEDRGVPNTLRTGFDGTDNGDGHVELDPKALRMITLAWTLVRRAAKTSALYCDHAGRAKVTVEDSNLALKYHARHFLSEDAIDELEAEVNVNEAEIVEHMNAETDSSDADTEMSGSAAEDAEEEQEGDEAMEDDDTSEEDDGEPWTRSSCECAVCAGIHEVDDAWDEWNPTDEAEIAIKAKTNDAIAKLTSQFDRP